MKLHLTATLLGLLLCACVRSPAVQEVRNAPREVVPDSVYDFKELTSPPRVLNPGAIEAAVARVYPPRLRDSGIAGAALLIVTLDPQGSLTDVYVDRATDVGFAEAAIQLAHMMRFRPGRIGNTPVRSKFSIPLTFTLTPP